MTTFAIGTDLEAQDEAGIDLERLLVSRLLVQANSGGGKSWTLRRLLEQLFGRVPQVVIDVDGEFGTLREKFAYVLASAGAGGDCKVDARTAPLLARRILEHGFSAIVDLSEMRKPQRAAFVRAFLEALMDAPRTLWRPLLVVLDEAHLFCPEKDQAESAAAVIDLMTRGRKRGFCGVLATQRIAKLHKDAAAEANNKLIGRAVLDVDVKRAAEEIGFTTREQQLLLRGLTEGRFYAYGPALRHRGVRLVQVGPVRTSHPEPGTRASAAPPAPAQLREILAKLADLPAEAEAEASEVVRLRAEVAELRRKHADLQRQGANSGVDRAAAGEIRSQAFRDGAAGAARVLQQDLDGPLQSVDSLVKGLRHHANHLERQAELIRARLGRAPLAPSAAEAPRSAMSPTPAKPRQEPQAARGAALGDSGAPAVTAPRQRILDALAWLETAGLTPARKVTLALLALSSPTSSGYDNNLGALRTAGLLDYPQPGRVALTDAGRAIAAVPARRPMSEDLHRTLAGVLPAPRWRILEAAIAAHPGELARRQLAEQAQQSPGSSGFDNNLGALRSMGFLDYPRAGFVKATDDLFIPE